jgi:excisionase family DNA binding protein
MPTKNPVKSKIEDPFIYFPLLSIAEADRYLGVGRKIVYQLIELDAIRAVKQKGKIGVEKKSLDEFRASGQLT